MSSPFDDRSLGRTRGPVGGQQFRPGGANPPAPAAPDAPPAEFTPADVPAAAAGAAADDAPATPVIGPAQVLEGAPQYPFQRYENWEAIVEAMRKEFAAVQNPNAPGYLTREQLTDPRTFFGFVTNAMRKHRRLNIPEHEFGEMAKHLYNELLGYGAIGLYLQDPDVEDVLVNSYKEIYIGKKGRKVLVADPARPETSPFRDERAVFDFLNTRIFGVQDKSLNRQNPFENATMADGSRVFAWCPPIGPYSGFTIRRHKPDVFQTLHQYKSTGVATDEFFADLDNWVKGKRNIVLSGQTGSGKTTLLNFAASLIPPEERLVVLEDTKELQIPHPHVVPFLTTSAGSKLGEDDQVIDMRKLLKASLRLAPDRILIGEVRDAEAFDAMDAMNTGHEGSLLTLHANSPIDAITRLQSMAIRAGKFSENALLRLIAQVVNIVVQIRRLPDGRRRIYGVVQVVYPLHFLSSPDILRDAHEMESFLYFRPLYQWDHVADRLVRVADFIVPDHG